MESSLPAMKIDFGVALDLPEVLEVAASLQLPT
jgi:hypothetical protein